MVNNAIDSNIAEALAITEYFHSLIIKFEKRFKVLFDSIGLVEIKKEEFINSYQRA